MNSRGQGKYPVSLLTTHSDSRYQIFPMFRVVFPLVSLQCSAVTASYCSDNRDLPCGLYMQSIYVHVYMYLLLCLQIRINISVSHVCATFKILNAQRVYYSVVGRFHSFYRPRRPLGRIEV
jgi:hypothetical protein